MVKDSGAKARSGPIRSLNTPLPIDVEADQDGRPLQARRQHRSLHVLEIEDSWRIDDEWWRGRPVSRLYFRVLLEDGHQMTLFYDLVKGEWYQQSYG